MIYNFHVELPFEVTITNKIAACVYQFDTDDYKIRIYPPQNNKFYDEDVQQLLLNPSSVGEWKEKLSRLGNRNEGSILSIEIYRESHESVERERVKGYAELFSPLIQKIANSFIKRLRYITREPRFKAINSLNNFHMCVISDDRLRVEEIEMILAGTVLKKPAAPWPEFTKDIWEKIHKLPPDFELSSWDDLQIQAKEQLPNHIGLALVLAYTALEVLIDRVLNELMAQSIKPEKLFEWVKENRIRLEEKFSTLLEIFTGESLKSNNSLWEDFKNLMNGRNNFVHKGVLEIKNDVLTVEVAQQLVKSSEKIIEFIMNLSPEELRPQNFDYELLNPQPQEPYLKIDE